MKKLLISLICFSLFALAAQAKTNFPYGEFNIKMPPLQEPYPGMGSNYSTISKGVGTIMWNPASLMKMNTVECSFSLSGQSDMQRFNKIISQQDVTVEATIQGITKSTKPATYGIYFDQPANIGTQIQTREIEGHYNFLTESTGITYQQSFKIFPWLAAGVIYRGPVESNANLAGDFPTVAKCTLDISHASFEASQNPMWLDGNDHFNFVYNNITSTTASPVWPDFLTQKAEIPLTSYCNFRNNVSVNSNLTTCFATEYKNVSFGVNLTPISAQINIDNSIRTVVNPGTSDITFYAPKFDPSSEASKLAWFTDINKYNSSEGYSRITSRVPAGQAVADANYKGFYSASALRMDLGAMYNVSENLIVGIAYENFNSAALNFTGSGIVTYAQNREVTFEPGSVINPTPTDLEISVIKDNYKPITGSENYFLEPQKNYSLPQKLRFGLAFVKPKVIALDYETQLNPLKFRTKDSTGNYVESTISNINMIRFGVDLDIFKGGATFLLKPSFSGLDANTQSNINKAFKFGVLPLKVDMGTTLNLWGWRNDSWIGLNALSIFDVLQFNTLNADLSKIFYYGLSFTKNYWTFGYQANIDPFATAAAYYAAKENDSSKQLEWGDLKWVSTLQATYRF